VPSGEHGEPRRGLGRPRYALSAKRKAPRAEAGKRVPSPDPSAQGPARVCVGCRRETAGLRARTGLSLGRGFREWGCGRCGRCCRHCAFGFSPGLGRSAGGRRAAGHGGLAASLQAFLAALPAASDLSFLLSHRGPPCRTGLRFLAVNEGPKIVPCGVAVNDSRQGVWCPRLAPLGRPSIRGAPWRSAPRGFGRLTNPCR
jgi:hypothetical protein